MELINKLDQEHRLIEKMSGSFIRLLTETTPTLLLQRKVRKELAFYPLFFQDYVDAYHHGKEEEILFTAFAELGLEGSTPPLQTLLDEHAGNKNIIIRMIGYSNRKDLCEAELGILRGMALQYCRNIWEHIDKEDSVCFPQALDRIRGKVRLLADKKLSQFEKNWQGREIQLLEETAAALIQKYPPVEDVDDYTRGEGCTNCQVYGISCQGIELEWWSEHEWDNFNARPL